MAAMNRTADDAECILTTLQYESSLLQNKHSAQNCAWIMLLCGRLAWATYPSDCVQTGKRGTCPGLLTLLPCWSGR